VRCGSWRRYGCRVVKGPRQRLATLLGATSGRGAFSARRTAAPGDLHIDVAGVGPLEIPVPAAQARQLCGIARPARYGLGEQTLTDSRVRSTWEVPKSRVRIDQRRWNRTLSPILAKLRADLGLSDGCTLKAELHSVLAYTPGQFFVPHQDSEKSDAMVGTLTVTLPWPEIESTALIMRLTRICSMRVRFTVTLTGSLVSSSVASTRPSLPACFSIVVMSRTTKLRSIGAT